ncbi:MucR family transcriptional regulator [Sphingobium sp. SCG-1]|uniref:MucR family transcriptional regulator n=1 Tax=Sphingobium sp. SCG-1 TaxID=2072936 RepID=UPI000CD6A9BE|nr:MucR family transcriptional regulator [Sphingobium sp. SCG-1]AUW59008.1 MucR family transcriptional regulator [Sphingobium sp. SCG-1]
MADHDQADLTTLTVDLLSAYFANNTVPSETLSDLIQSTYSALAGIDAPAAVEAEAPTFTPAVSLRKSLASRDHIISMIDGKAYKTLKRHLAANGLSPAEYRERYKLPASYPMVAPAYSEERRAVAAKNGLGGSKKRAGVMAEDAAPLAVASTPRADAIEDAADIAPVAANEPAIADTIAVPKAARKVRAVSAKLGPKGSAAKAVKPTRKSEVDSVRDNVAAADQDVEQPAQTATPTSSASDAPTKPRRKLKIRAGEPAQPESMLEEAAKAKPSPKPREAKAGNTDQSTSSDAPKPTKRAYKKRVSKSVEA